MLIKTDLKIIQAYFEDSSNLKGGHADEVVIPDNAEELAGFLKEANGKRMPVTVSGGGTGTTGSRIPFGGAVMSMERFSRISAISRSGMYGSLQAGVLVDDFKNACEEKGLFYTSHPTERTASVGGTVATNASGSRSFKYGSTRKYVRRLKMVLANGQTLDIRRGERFITSRDNRIRLDQGLEIIVPVPSYKMPGVKNSAGYFAKDGMDAIDLFIGQEGTLAIITDIELALARKPAAILSAFVFFANRREAWNFASEIRNSARASQDRAAHAIDALSVEYFDRNTLALINGKEGNIPPDSDAAIFFEQELDGRDEDAQIDSWMAAIERHNASTETTWVAMNESEAEKFILLRHQVPEAINNIVRHRGFQKVSTDIAVPDDKFSEMMNFYDKVFTGSGIEYAVFGHIGECHVHTNLMPKTSDEMTKAIEMNMSFIRKGVALGGTISAEHGVGKTKHKYLEIMYGRSGMLEMARIKKAFDPNCILGRGNIISMEIVDSV